MPALRCSNASAGGVIVGRSLSKPGLSGGNSVETSPAVVVVYVLSDRVEADDFGVERRHTVLVDAGGGPFLSQAGQLLVVFL